MSQVETAVNSSVVSVYPGSWVSRGRVAAADRGRVRDEGCIDRGPRLSGEGGADRVHITTRHFAAVGAGTGAWVGGLFGLLVGAAFSVCLEWGR